MHLVDFLPARVRALVDLPSPHNNDSDSESDNDTNKQVEIRSTNWLTVADEAVVGRSQVDPGTGSHEARQHDLPRRTEKGSRQRRKNTPAVCYDNPDGTGMGDSDYWPSWA